MSKQRLTTTIEADALTELRRLSSEHGRTLGQVIADLVRTQAERIESVYRANQKRLGVDAD